MRLIVAAHDPGGFNLLIPIIEDFQAKNHEVHLLLAGEAKNRWDKRPVYSLNLFNHQVGSFSCAGFPGEFDVKKWDIDKLISSIRPDFILTSTSINSNIERYCIRYAKTEKIPNASIIDSWTGNENRFASSFVTAHSDHILVVDEQMKDVFSGLERLGCRLIVAGNPHLEQIRNRRKESFDTAANAEEFSRAVFFSENIFHYFPKKTVNEFTIIEKIINEYNAPSAIEISIRPHPLEDRRHWYRFVDDHSGHNAKIKLSVDEYPTIEESTANAKLTFGISSMALIESSMLGKPTYSFQVDLPEKENMLYIPFERYGIGRLTTISAVVNAISSNPVAKEYSDGPDVQSNSAVKNVADLILNLTLKNA